MTRQQAEYRANLASIGQDKDAKEYSNSLNEVESKYENHIGLSRFYYENLPDDFEQASESNCPYALEGFDSDECVYLIYNPSTHLYKIGISNNPYRRIKELERASGCNLFFVIYIQMEANYDESAYTCEQILHKYYEKERQLGEWFKLNGDQVHELYTVLLEDVCGADMEDQYQEYLSLCQKSGGINHYLNCSTPIGFRKYGDKFYVDLVSRRIKNV